MDCRYLPGSSILSVYPTAVLLGPDHVGKTSLARELSRRGFAAVSCDEELLNPDYEVLRHIRRAGPQLLQAGASAELLVSGMDMLSYYLRDEMLRCRCHKPVIVDGYYYKLLAKCRLHRLASASTLARWRRLQPPDHVIYLHLSADQLWERADRGRDLNAFEYFGRRPTRAGFIRYQTALTNLMRRETANMNVSTIDARGTLAEVCEHVERLLRTEQTRKTA